MSTAALGTRRHEALYLHESIRSLCRLYGASDRQADHAAYVADMMWSDVRCTKEEAIAAADRLFPVTNATRPAPEPESGASTETSLNH
jgi:hypothetical protein